jgi:hypothetical protein
MIFRIILGAGLLVAGYYVGREVGRNELLDKKLHGKGRKRRVEGEVVDSTEYTVTDSK